LSAVCETVAPLPTVARSIACFFCSMLLTRCSRRRRPPPRRISAPLPFWPMAAPASAPTPAPMAVCRGPWGLCRCSCRRSRPRPKAAASHGDQAGADGEAVSSIPFNAIPKPDIGTGGRGLLVSDEAAR
jgi:hypothetical protein